MSIDYHEAPGMMHSYPLFPIPEAEVHDGVQPPVAITAELIGWAVQSLEREPHSTRFLQLGAAEE